MNETLVPGWLWWAFAGFVVPALALDLGVFHRKAHAVSVKEAGAWLAVWVGLALAFCAGLFFKVDSTKSLEFLTGYVIELALSIDNIFVFIVIFQFFGVPAIYQHRVLLWGILGALFMRAIFIFLGGALISRFHWVLYVFGAFLIFTGFKILFQKKDEEVDPEKNLVVRLFRRFVPLIGEYRGPRFLVVENGKRYATLLLLVLVLVEATDVVFAVDSIPAIFAVTTDTFIIYTSNIFAILGLRNLFFLLSGIMDKFHYLKVGLGLVLVFVGAKMLADIWGVKLPIHVSLGVIVGVLGLSILASIFRKPPADSA